MKDVISFYKYHKTGIFITPTIDVSSRKTTSNHILIIFNEINNSRFNPASSFPVLLLAPSGSYRK